MAETLPLDLLEARTDKWDRSTENPGEKEKGERDTQEFKAPTGRK